MDETKDKTTIHRGNSKPLAFLSGLFTYVTLGLSLLFWRYDLEGYAANDEDFDYEFYTG